MLIEGNVRQDILNAAHKVGKKGAHIAPSLSVVEIIISILSMYDEKKDCFLLSKGHGALGYYAVMHQLGMITDAQYNAFEDDGGDFPGQPCRSKYNNVRLSSGSLGMGLSYGLGVALSSADNDGKVYVVLGDGEMNEGSNWEAIALASRYNLQNMIAVIDNNDLQSDGCIKDIMNQNLKALFEASGWVTKECDGHSINELKSAINTDHFSKPLAIIAKTIKGKGISFMENNNSWHHAVLDDESYDKATREIRIRYEL